MTMMGQGYFLFCYLRIPLYSTKLSLVECKTLVDKITMCVKHWANRHLSYAGKLELIKMLIGGITNFWAQVFPLPKKAIKDVNRICGYNTPILI